LAQFTLAIPSDVPSYFVGPMDQHNRRLLPWSESSKRLRSLAHGIRGIYR
jgi:hypothetical protein